jgi:hypothetical protein
MEKLTPRTTEEGLSGLAVFSACAPVIKEENRRTPVIATTNAREFHSRLSMSLV